MSAALLTSDTPRWLFLALVALVGAAYLACAIPTLTGRASSRARRRTRRPVSARAITSRRRR